MSLNKSTGNMYEFVTHTWNTIKGACPHDCSYCYMKRWGDLKPVRFDEKEFRTDLGQNNFIFVGSSCDMWADEIPKEYILKTLEHCRTFGMNRYLFQTKNPQRIADYIPELPVFSTICTTLESDIIYPAIMRESPWPVNRVWGMIALKGLQKHITIEPILDFTLDRFVESIRLCEPNQVNIGADSGRNNLPEPSADKVRSLIAELSKFTRVVQKKNLARLLCG
jgi:DNA repair photolyase